MLYGITSNKSMNAQLMKDYYIGVPLWDETTAAIMASPDLITSQVKAYMDVNTVFDCLDLVGRICGRQRLRRIIQER